MKLGRKLTVLTLVLASVFVSGVTAYAACHTGGYRQAVGCAFVDANGDGYCDNWGTSCAFIDADGNGICDNRPLSCAGYLDANADGICDRCGRLQNTAGWCHGTAAAKATATAGVSYGHHGRGHGHHGSN